MQNLRHELLAAEHSILGGAPEQLVHPLVLPDAGAGSCIPLENAQLPGCECNAQTIVAVLSGVRYGTGRRGFRSSLAALSCQLLFEFGDSSFELLKLQI